MKTFNKELAKEPKSKSGDAAQNYKSSWFLYDSMLFVKEKNFKKTSGNLLSEESDSDDEEIENDVKNWAQQKSDPSTSQSCPSTSQSCSTDNTPIRTAEQLTPTNVDNDAD